MLVLAECNAVPRLNGLTYAEVPAPPQTIRVREPVTLERSPGPV